MPHAITTLKAGKWKARGGEQQGLEEVVAALSGTQLSKNWLV